LKKATGLGSVVMATASTINLNLIGEIG